MSCIDLLFIYLFSFSKHLPISRHDMPWRYSMNIVKAVMSCLDWIKDISMSHILGSPSRCVERCILCGWICPAWGAGWHSLLRMKPGWGSKLIWATTTKIWAEDGRVILDCTPGWSTISITSTSILWYRYKKQRILHFLKPWNTFRTPLSTVILAVAAQISERKNVVIFQLVTYSFVTRKQTGFLWHVAKSLPFATPRFCLAYRRYSRWLNVLQ